VMRKKFPIFSSSPAKHQERRGTTLKKGKRRLFSCENNPG
jgi:hypothetical protein